MLPVTVAHSSPKLLNKVQPTSEPAACEPATKTLPTREDTSAQAPECEGRKALPESAAIEAGPESGDEESLELSVHKQFQAIDFSALTLEEFKALPLTQRECKIWAANGGWKIDGYEAGASEEDSRVHLLCGDGHPKTSGVVWFLGKAPDGGHLLPATATATATATAEAPTRDTVNPSP
eukprot:gene24376-9986_t